MQGNPASARRRRTSGCGAPSTVRCSGFVSAPRQRPSLDERVRVPFWHRALEGIVHLAAWTSLGAVLLVVGFVLKEALPFVFEGVVDARDLLLSRQWPGYDEPAAVWQPVGTPPKYNLWPLIVGTLKVTSIAMLVAAPVGVAAATFSVTYLPPRVRAVLKPAVEVLAGVPTVVVGFFMLVVLSEPLHAHLGWELRLNATLAALGLAVTLVPVIYAFAEDALFATPREHWEAARALGARRYQAALYVALPAAAPGIFAGLLLALGRALGETMVILMASGNAAVVRLFEPASSARTLTTAIAMEVGEATPGSTHWQVLFGLGTLLFAVSFAVQYYARTMTRRMQARRRRAGGGA